MVLAGIECSPKISDFRASGIPVQERVDFLRHAHQPAGLKALQVGLFLLFSDVNITSMSLIESAVANKIIVLIIMIGLSLFFLLLGFGYLKKAKRYYKGKIALESEEIVESGEDHIWQRTCPKCGNSHDIDYPKCPKCNFNYLE